MERAALYEAIDARVERMLAEGAREEVRARQRRRSLGDGAQGTRLPGAARRATSRAMKRRTRNYAKRQLTWMRKLAGVHLIDVGGRVPASVAQEILRDAEAPTRVDEPPRRARPDAGPPYTAAQCDSRSGRRWATTT